MDTTILAVAIALTITHIVYTEYVNSDDQLAEYQTFYEAPTNISDKSTTFAYKIEKKDKISLSETTFSE
jgi:hypothetical protein